MDSVILDWIRELGPWSWAVLGIALLALEALIPGVFLFWFGLAAIAVAIQAALIPLPWQAQLAFFIVYSVVLVFLARRLSAKRGEGDAAATLNRRADALKGRTATLSKPIENGYGEIGIDDSHWRVRGPDLAAGTAVTVTGSDGAVLIVAPVGAGETAAPAEKGDESEG